MIDVYGALADDAQQKWLDINEAIAGQGATPITNVDVRVSAHVPLLDDGAGNLQDIYQADGDEIHENTAGGQIIVDAWEAALVNAGIAP
jgi:hypothetical protein